MRSIVLLCFLSACAQCSGKSFFLKLVEKKQRLIFPPTLKNLRGVSTLFYSDQTLDHFNAETNHTWKQRYFVNDEFFTDKDNAPIFLTIGGEATASASWMKYGAWYGYAEQVGALMIQLEHRFYGQSHPTDNMSVDNLKYLTSQQALEDTAQFIEFIQESYNVPHNKWVTFGGSYPGSLSLWMRSLYPNLVAGALSSSAPVEAKVDFEEYLGVIDQDMRIRDPSCSNSVIEGITQMEELLAMGQGGWHEIAEVFNLCAGWSGEKDKDVKTLFMSIIEAFALGAQYDSNEDAENVAKLCSYMNNEAFRGETNMEQLAKTVNIVYGGECLNANYADFVEKLKFEDFSEDEYIGYRQWTYQTCNEFGWFQTGNLWGSFLPVSYFIELCTDLYGSEFTNETIHANIQKSNNFYGSKNPSLSNAIITHGSFDPWHAMGIVQDLSETVRAFLINGTSHCYDLYPPNPSLDSFEVDQVRNITLEHIKNWIK